jgi:beta-galactosidase
MKRTLRRSNLGRLLEMLLLLVFAALFLDAAFGADKRSASPMVIDARTPPSPPQPLLFSAGGSSRDGHTFSANNRYLMRDGKPWFPVMGEFHFSRYPELHWEDEILKMKAGGIQVVSTYVFWIHHEEVKGQFDWTGQRDLRRFVELCAKHGMYVWIRVGPWGHGEARNGGLPDWLIEEAPTRENNAIYLSHVSRFFSEIARQLDKLFWKDDGPVIGIQLENEYSARGPGKGAEHILQLLKMAREAGLDAPFYTVTGWDNAVLPSRDVLPVFGGYADGFWWRSLLDLPPNPNYFFTHIRCEELVGDDLRSKRPDIDATDAAYPFLTAEMGGGMESSYHRRPRLSADDTAAMELVKLGSGVTGYGYYMFHGGTNPDGKKTTLQESQSTGYPNDLPVKSYDFQAPLGEFGQMNESFRVLKTIDLFLNDFGTSLASMTSYLPDRMPASKTDTSTPRVAARVQRDHGFIFLNNHARTYALPERKNFQVKLELPSGVLDVPRRPVDIPRDTYAVWPVNLDLGGTVLRYATAQLLCRLDDPETYVFFAWPGISPEFAFKETRGVSIESPAGHITRDGKTAYVDGVEPGTRVAIRLNNGKGKSINIIVLSREQALNTWKAPLAGRERLILSGAQLYFDRDRMHLLASDSSQLRAELFPALDHDPAGFVPDGADGIFKIYSAHVPLVSGMAKIEPIQSEGADPPLKMGKEVVMAPEDSAFSTAASWAIHVPPVTSGATSDVFLQIAYQGDIARLYAGGKLITDNFYNGTPWLIGLDRVPRSQWDQLELKILPLQDRAPIYLPEGARPAVSPGGQSVKLNSVQIIPQYEVVMDLSY